MFDIGWTELLVIGVVALIVVGPKDLPIMFRKLGQFTAKARGMAREFQRAMEEAADESGVKDVSRDLRNMTSPKKLGLDKLKEATRDIDKPSAARRSKDEAAAKGAEGAKKEAETQKLREERAEKARVVREATARKAEERRAAAGDVARAPEPKPAKAAGSGGDA